METTQQIQTTETAELLFSTAKTLSTQKCPDCGEPAREAAMVEDGVSYKIWKCTKNMYHWGSR